MTQKRSMTQLEQLSVLTDFQESVIDSLAVKNMRLKRNLVGALFWLVTSLVVITGVVVWQMFPTAFHTITQFFSGFLTSSVLIWLLLIFTAIFVLFFWALAVWSEIKASGINS